MSITHIKNLNTLVNLLINYVPASSAPKRLYTNCDCTFLFLEFLIISSCNSLAYLFFEIFSFLIPLPEVFLSKHLQITEASQR